MNKETEEMIAELFERFPVCPSLVLWISVDDLGEENPDVQAVTFLINDVPLQDLKVKEIRHSELHKQGVS